MDRHICKAKRQDNGEWVHGYYVQCDGEINHGRAFILPEVIGIHCTDYEAMIDGFIEVDPDTVCRCTGWIDSHQIPIFEKDIVEFVGAITHRDLVCWCNEMNMMNDVPLDGIEFNGHDYWNGKYPKCDYSTFCFLMQDPYGDFKEIKVVGNIVDNPELLEEE